MPRAPRAAATGIEPPERASTGRTPSTCSNASCASRTAGAAGIDEAGLARRPERDLEARATRARPRGAAARTRARSPPASARARAGSRGSPAPRRGARSSGGVGEPPSKPLTVDGRLGGRAERRTPRPRAASVGRAPCDGELLAARRQSALQPATSSSVGGTIPARSGSGSSPSGPGSTAESTCISAWVALSAAPPNMPEWRSRSPVRTRQVEVADAAQRGAERRQRLGRVAAVEDRARRPPAAVVLARPSRRPSARRPPPRRRSRSARSRAARRRRRGARSPRAA